MNNPPAPLVETFILGVSGKKRSGKDEVSQVAGNQFATQDKMGRNIFRFYIADSLKDMFTAKLGISRMELEHKKDFYRTDLQDYAQKMRVERGEDYWIKQVRAKIKSIPKEPALIIIPDVRYQFEADWLVSIGANMWRVVRPGFDSGDNHISETNLDKWDKWDEIIINDGTIGSLHNNVRLLTDKYFSDVYDKNLEQILKGGYGHEYRW